jgi:hypothetical protein
MFEYFNTPPNINNERRKTTESESNDILDIEHNQSNSKDKKEDSTYSMESSEIQLAESVKRAQDDFIEKRLNSIKEKDELINRQKRELDQREIHLDRRDQKLKECNLEHESVRAKLKLNAKQ